MSWSHFKTLIYLDDPLKRDFYAEICRVERWSTRVLAQKVQGMLSERTALSKIHVAEYLTQLPAKPLFEARFQQALRAARASVAGFPA